MSILTKFIDKQVDDAVELIFANAHGMAMTTSGDITPEQQAKLDELKGTLKHLVYTQVMQNMDIKQEVHVTPYDDEMGTAWKLMFGDETVEDGFDSTADAEMWAKDNGYTPVSHEAKTWVVPVCRISYGHKNIVVEATTEQEAIDLAIDAAGDESFSENDAEYSAPDGAHTKL